MEKAEGSVNKGDEGKGKVMKFCMVKGRIWLVRRLLEAMGLWVGGCWELLEEK